MNLIITKMMKYIKKNNYIYYISYLLFIFFSIIIILYPDSSSSNTNGSIGGKTGSPNDNTSCLQCHNAINGNNGSISSNIPITGYVPNEVYTISTNITQNGINKFGFEITAEQNNIGSSKVGNFIITNNEIQYTNNNHAVTHTPGSSISNNSKSWSMQWQAPNSGNGEITFYAAFIAANGDGTSAGDNIHFATLNVNEGISNTIDNTEKFDNISYDSFKKIIKINSKSKTIVYNIEGKKVMETNQKLISVSHFKDGIYIIETNNITKIIKL